MGVYANYNATPPGVVEAHRADPVDLREKCEFGEVPALTFSLHKGWRLVWSVLEPEAFLATPHPTDAPLGPASPLGAAVVGAAPLNESFASEQADRVGSLYHTRWNTPSEVGSAAAALASVSDADIASAYESGAVSRAFSGFAGAGVAGPSVARSSVDALREFYESARAREWAVVVMVG